MAEGNAFGAAEGLRTKLRFGRIIRAVSRALLDEGGEPGRSGTYRCSLASDVMDAAGLRCARRAGRAGAARPGRRRVVPAPVEEIEGLLGRRRISAGAGHMRKSRWRKARGRGGRDEGRQRAESSGGERADRPRPRNPWGRPPGLFPAMGRKWPATGGGEAAAPAGNAGDAGGESGGGYVLRRRPHRVRAGIAGSRRRRERTARRGYSSLAPRPPRRSRPAPTSAGQGDALALTAKFAKACGIDRLPGRSVEKRIRQARDQTRIDDGRSLPAPLRARRGRRSARWRRRDADQAYS